MSDPITRILSDFHYYDPASGVEHLCEVKPLIEGPARVVMNGDTLDTHVHDRPEEVVAEVKAFFAQHSLDTTFIAGNHDPDISLTDELSLEGGSIWITHGHVFFDAIAPWSRLAPEIRRRFQAQCGSFPPPDFTLLEKRFQLFRQVCSKLPREHDPNQRGTIARLRRMAYAVFPPHQIFGMVKAWRALPHLARAVAKAQRPLAQIIVTGHTHYPGVWRGADGRVVINTGSFCPPQGGRIVDVSKDRVVVRRILRRGREFHPGSIVAEITLAPTRPSTVSALP